MTGAHHQNVPDHPLRMVRLHLDDTPGHAAPHGVRIRGDAPGDDATWTDIQLDAQPILEIDAGRFRREFGDDIERLSDRCLFLTTRDGVAVGTITAWQRQFAHLDQAAMRPRDPQSFRAAIAKSRGSPRGLPCWLALRPDHQGRGLSRPLLTAALRRLAVEHSCCCALTSTARFGAIRRWTEFGFRPDLTLPAARDAWDRLMVAVPDLASVRPATLPEQHRAD